MVPADLAAATDPLAILAAGVTGTMVLYRRRVLSIAMPPDTIMLP